MAGRNLLVAYYLTRVRMMTTSGVYWQNWSNNVVGSSHQRWRGWSVALLFKMILKYYAGWSHFECFLGSVSFYCGPMHQVTDLTLARENQTNFEEYLAINPQVNTGIDLTVTVLTTGFWPSYKSFDLNLPEEMVSSWKHLFSNSVSWKLNSNFWFCVVFSSGKMCWGV